MADLAKQIRRLWFVGLIIYGPVFCLAVFLKYGTDLFLYDLVVDASVIAELPFYIGIISNAGILLWCAAASLCLFSWYLLRGRGDEWGRFFLLFGSLTLYICLDDFFLLHEGVFPHYAGIPEVIVLAGIGGRRFSASRSAIE